MLQCTGCGSTESIEEIRRKHPDAIACCPERDMQPAWRPFSDAPKNGQWIIARCNDKSALFYISWGTNRRGEMSWCSQDHSYGDGLFMPNGDWIAAPSPGQNF